VKLIESISGLTNRWMVCLLILLVISGSAVGADEQVPKSITESVAELKRTLPPATVSRWRSSPESIISDSNLSLGTWVRNQWIRGKSSNSLSKYFLSQGVYSPDDMSFVILTSFWRDLHGQPMNIEKQLAEVRKANVYFMPQVTEVRSLPADVWNREIVLSSGKKCRLSEFKGKVLILVIAFLDGRSVDAMQAVNRVITKNSGKDVAALGILHTKVRPGDKVTAAEQSSFINNARVDYPLVADEPDNFVYSIANALIAPGGMSLPEVIVIGKNGKMITRFHLWSSETEAKLNASVENALKQ